MKRTSLRRISTKQRAKQRAWAEVVKERMAMVNGWCEIHVAGVCKGRATDGHHIKSRARGGKNEMSNCLCLCNACHMKIHREPIWAAAWGFIK